MKIKSFRVLLIVILSMAALAWLVSKEGQTAWRRETAMKEKDRQTELLSQESSGIPKTESDQTARAPDRGQTGKALEGSQAIIDQDTGADDMEKAPEIPASYDGRKRGRVPAVKNQGSYGTCWAFASLKALEARLLPKEQREFSEDHMSLNNGFEIPEVEGGEFTMSMAYLLSWRGPVLEADDPYGDGFSPDNLRAVKHIQEIQLLPGKDYKKIKRAVLEYGGVQSSLYTSMSDDKSRSVYYNEGNNSYCYIGSNPPNHDSVIIGWDDNYPKENFNEAVNGNGAFICMNSWGPDFGEEGFFYVSYYDSNIGMNNIVYTRVEEADNYGHIYQSDLRGWVGQLGYGEETVWFANVYEAKGEEQLKAAGFYATGPDTSYELYLSADPGQEQEIAEKGFQNKLLVARGRLENAGYYTIPLTWKNTETQVLKGQRFALIVKVTTPDAVHPAAIEYDAEDGRTQVDITDGEGYISPDGFSWDRVEKNKNCNLCLKAYTTDRKQVNEGDTK